MPSNSKVATNFTHTKSIMENIEDKVSIKNYNYIQWLAVFSGFLLNMQLGLSNGWMSPNFASLISEESPIPATKNDLSWIVTISSIASAIGAILGSISIGYLGTRTTLIFIYFVFCLNWICLTMATSIKWVYFARIFAGLSQNIELSCSCMYLGEISSPQTRGTFISLALVGGPIGALSSTIAETYLPKEISTLLYLSVALFGIILMLWLKSTPYYLVNKNDLAGAVQSIEFYHADKETEIELEAIKSFAKKNECASLGNKISELRFPVIQRSLLTLIFLVGLSIWSGYSILLAYMEIILKSAEFNLVKPQEFVIYATLFKILGASIVVKMIDSVGRKFLIIISSVGTSIAMFALGLHFHLLSIGIDGTILQLLPVFSIITYLIAYFMGFVPVPGTFLSEIFPEHIKSTALVIAAISAPLINVIIAKAYQPIVDFAGEQYAFWMFSLLSLLGIPCALFLMIETKGKSFLEIQNELTIKWQT